MKSFHATVALFSILAISSISAQEVRDYDLGTILGRFQATRIGVEEVRYIGDRYINAEDSSLMRYVTGVIQRDIDFYADFELVQLDPFYLTTYEIEAGEMDLRGWKRLGSDYVIKLEAEFPGPNVRVFWRLFHATSESQVAKGNLEYKCEFWRELAHDVANEVVNTLTGDRGVFRTKIAYIKMIDNAKEIFIADYNGVNERQLTHTGTINISPVFSPDGQMIYFTSYLNGDPQLFRVSVRSSEIEEVTSYSGIAIAPAISPDGNKIACTLSKDGNSEIYVLNLDGNVIKRLTRHRAIDSSPTWSPDGRMIAFSSDRTGAPQIYIMDSDGLNIKRLTFTGGYNDSPIWSDRGTRITFVSRTKRGRFDLASVDTSGVDYRILTEVGHNENPHFSPDGKHLVFSSTRLSEGDIYTMDLSGRNQRRVTRSANCSNPTWGPIQ